MNEQLGNVHVSRHPLIEDKLNAIRDALCPPQAFRRLVHEISMLLTYELMADLPASLPWEIKPIVTPQATLDTGRILGGHPPVLVPILRAGLAVAEGAHAILSTAHFGHIGIHRNDITLEPIEYLVKLPKTKDRLFLLTDIMIATGNTANHAIKVLKKYGVHDDNIRMLSILSSYRGIKNLQEKHPNVLVFTGFIDGFNDSNDGLNSDGYIVPGLGDAGDRLFGTLFDEHKTFEDVLR